MRTYRRWSEHHDSAPPEPSTGHRPCGPLDRTGRLLCWAYVAAIGIPLFVLPGHRATNLTILMTPDSPAAQDPQPLRLHWVVAFAGMVTAYFLVRALVLRRLELPPHTTVVAALLLALSAALVAGLVTEPHWLKVVYFAQTTIPFVGFLVGAHLAHSTQDVRRLGWILVTATTLSIAGILALAFSYGLFSPYTDAARKLAQGVPQLKNYFPFIVAASLSVILGGFQAVGRSLHKTLLGFALGVHLLFYSLTWSRMALIMLAVVVLSHLVFRGRSTLGKRRWRVKATASILVLCAAVILVGQGAFKTRWERRNWAESDSRRVQFAMEAVELIARNPLFGRMFSADWERDPRPARELRIPRVYKAHNQYLDYAVRAGVPALFALGAVLWTAALNLRRTLIHTATPPRLQPMAIGVAGALLAVTVGNMTQLFLIQAQTGSLAWLLIGVAAKLPSIADQQRGADTGGSLP